MLRRGLFASLINSPGISLRLWTVKSRAMGRRRNSLGIALVSAILSARWCIFMPREYRFIRFRRESMRT